MGDLRAKLIRLAYQQPELRKDILPLLRQGATKEAKWQDTLKKLWNSYKKEHPKSKAPPSSLVEQAKKEEPKKEEPKKEEPKKEEPKKEEPKKEEPKKEEPKKEKLTNEQIIENHYRKSYRAETDAMQEDLDKEERGDYHMVWRDERSNDGEAVPHKSKHTKEDLEKRKKPGAEDEHVKKKRQEDKEESNKHAEKAKKEKERREKLSPKERDDEDEKQREDAQSSHNLHWYGDSAGWGPQADRKEDSKKTPPTQKERLLNHKNRDYQQGDHDRTASLRSSLIRLAYQQPNLRKDILPLLR